MICEGEKLITLSEAAALLPRVRGKKVAVTSVWRWARRGVRGVRLESRFFGGRLFTSAEALDRFGERLAESGIPGSTNASDPHDSAGSLDPEREREIQGSERRVARRGCREDHGS